MKITQVSPEDLYEEKYIGYSPLDTHDTITQYVFSLVWKYTSVDYPGHWVELVSKEHIQKYHPLALGGLIKLIPYESRLDSLAKVMQAAVLVEVKRRNLSNKETGIDRSSRDKFVTEIQKIMEKRNARNNSLDKR